MMCHPQITAAGGGGAARRSATGGFTLLELMVVITIIGILMGFLLTSGGAVFRDAKSKQTRTQLETLASLINEYRTIENQFPDDRLPVGVHTGAMNSQAEALVLALFDREYTGNRPKLDSVINTDDDRVARNTTIFAEPKLFEIKDAWDNPILYFESLHYGDVATVMAGYDLYYEEQTTGARKHKTTGAYLSPNGFQLVSAGEDGVFDTEDDIILAR